MIDEKKRKCGNCGEMSLILFYDCVYEKYFCEKCNNCKPEHSDEAITKAFKKITDKHMKRWF